MYSRQGTDLYFRRIGDKTRTRPAPWQLINPRTDAPKDILVRPLSAVPRSRRTSGDLLHRSWFLENDGERRVSPELWGQIEPMGGNGRRGSRQPGGQRARTTRQSRGLSKRHENGSTVRFPFSRPTVAASVRVGSHGRGVAPGPPGGKSDGGVVGEETRLVGTPIHAHPVVEGWERERDGIATPLVLLHDPAGGACGIWWNRYDIARLTRRLPPHTRTHTHINTPRARARICTLERERLTGKLLSPISTSAYCILVEFKVRDKGECTLWYIFSNYYFRIKHFLVKDLRILYLYAYVHIKKKFFNIILTTHVSKRRPEDVLCPLDVLWMISGHFFGHVYC